MRRGAWINILFSFLIIISAAMMISWLIGGKEPQLHIAFTILILSFLCSLLFFQNIFNSGKIHPTIPNSCVLAEIILYLFYLGLASSALLCKSPILILLSSGSGLLLLAAIDNSENKIFHNGQAFLTVLLIASFFSGMRFPFLFIAIIKLICCVFYILTTETQNIYLSLRILRILLLLTAGFAIFRNLFYSDPLIICLFLLGEFIDRILFYRDLNILYVDSDK